MRSNGCLGIIRAALNNCSRHFSAAYSKIALNHFICISDEHIQRQKNELQPKQTPKKSRQKLNRSQSEVAAALTPVSSSLRGEPRAPVVVNVL